jgi:hypothetical protein
LAYCLIKEVAAFESFRESGLSQFLIGFIGYFNGLEDSNHQSGEEVEVASSANFSTSAEAASAEATTAVEGGFAVAAGGRFRLSFKIIINAIVKAFAVVVD